VYQKPADALPVGVSGIVAVPNRAGIALGGNGMEGRASDAARTIGCGGRWNIRGCF